METSDAKLVTDYLDGDEEALKTLISRHIGLVYNFTYRISGNAEEANDITQETFFKVWKNLKKYDPERKFTTWLLTIARNTTLDWLKKRKALSFSDMNDGDEEGTTFEENIEDTEPLQAEIFEKNENEELVTGALSQIAFDYRDVITLHIYEGLTFREIAEIEKLPVNTVKSRYRRGLMALKKNLEMHQKS